MPSTTGNQRSSYVHYEDAFKKTLVLYKSDEVEPTNLHHRNAKYNIALNNTIRCDSNQIITCALHSADIPMTTYQINRFNDTLYLYLPDWSHVDFGLGVSARGVIAVRLPRRNYTTSQLVAKLQIVLNGLVDTTFASQFSVVGAAGDGYFDAKQPGFVEVPITVYPSIHTGADQETLAGLFTGFAFPAVGTNNKYRHATAVFTYTPVGSSATKANLGIHDTSGTIDAVYIKTQPRFTVALEETGRISIKRVDILGSIPPKSTVTATRFFLSSGKANPLHLGLNKPSWGGSSPASADFGVNIYNTSGRFDDTREVGSIMQSQHQDVEFAAPVDVIAGTHRNRIFFPNVPNLNCHSTIQVRSTKLKANVYSGGKLSNVVAKIPINVQQGSIINYEPRHLIRYNLGNGSQVQFIDIELCDGDGQLLDFNGQPHDMSFLFEVWNVVSIPLHRQASTDFAFHDPFAPQQTDRSFRQRFDQADRTHGDPSQLRMSDPSRHAQLKRVVADRSSSSRQTFVEP